MGGPLAVNMFCFYAIQVVTMAFLGHCGEVRLAAASLAMVACNTLGSLVLMGLTGATSTLAAQVCVVRLLAERK
jgi:Na+-driven multidrug efflux pump